MIRRLLQRVTYERFAIAFMGLCIAVLYYLAAADLVRVSEADGAAPPVPVRAAAAVPAPGPGKPVFVRWLDSEEKVSDLFTRIGYHLDGVRENGEVPRVFLANLPSDLPRIRVPSKRKVLFIKTALPLILHVNELITLDRQRIIALRDKVRAGETLAAEEQAWLAEKADEYGLETVDFDALLLRVDIIPPSLALAQSAVESGWGTSRFAHEGNALFGQRVYRGDGGLVPRRRDRGKNFRVRAFDQLVDGVKSYARNLNSHFAYETFREARAALRRRGEDLDGDRLAGTLTRYSERGTAYVESIRTIIRANGLGLFDKARLGDKVAITVGGPDA